LGLVEGSDSKLGQVLQQLDHDRECTKRTIPQLLKLILLGYCVTHGWTLWASLERGTPARIVPRGLIEAPQFIISRDFRSARFGALGFRIVRVDRMDLMQNVSNPEYEVSRWTEYEIMNAVRLQETRPDGTRARSVSLDELLEASVLSDDVQAISRDVRRKIVERSEAFWAERKIVRGGIVEPVQAEGEAKVAWKSRGKGRPSKQELVQYGFFCWLERQNGRRLRGIMTAKTEIADLLKELKDSDIVGDTVHPRTIKDQLEELGYLAPRNDSPRTYKWVSEVWEEAFRSWKKWKEINS